MVALGVGIGLKTQEALFSSLPGFAHSTMGVGTRLNGNAGIGLLESGAVMLRPDNMVRVRNQQAQEQHDTGCSCCDRSITCPASM